MLAHPAGALRSGLSGDPWVICTTVADTDVAGLVVQVPFWAPYAAVAVSGLAGATYAAKRGFDVVGVFGISAATGLGGLILRDIFLNNLTDMFREPAYLIVAFWTAIVGFLFAGLISRFDPVMVILDGLSMGFLCFVGADAAFAAGLPWSSALLIGVITGTGGLILRDVLAGSPPEIVRPGVFIAIPAFASSSVFVAISEFGWSPVLAQAAALLVALVLRAGAFWFGWRTGSAQELSDRVWSYWYRSERKVKSLTVRETTEYFDTTSQIPVIKPKGKTDE